MNVYILVTLILQLRRIQRSGPGGTAEDEVFKIQGVGLGFDTSSEIALLGISSIQAAKGTPIWIILIFPILFTAGMCLIDTIDGALMLVAYTSTALAHDNIAVLYYSIVLSVVTCIVAVVIGTLQMLNMVLNVAEPTGRFWDGVAAAGDRYDVIGGCIVATFIVVGCLSLWVYRPWRRRFEKRREKFGLVVGIDGSVVAAGGGEDVVGKGADVKGGDNNVEAHVIATSSNV
ncbi:hypothetical protein AA313_de0202041 [Arthrobotrys entomopaga]|nr:hypothetical protein AA313_de0202041 [Arthrobotrys entomopaga]